MNCLENAISASPVLPVSAGEGERSAGGRGNVVPDLSHQLVLPSEDRESLGKVAKTCLGNRNDSKPRLKAAEAETSFQDEEANPAEEEDEEVWEDGDSGHRRLEEAQLQKSKVKGSAQEIQFLKVKWQDRRRQIATKVINKTTATSPQTSKKETQAFLGAIGFWRMHIPEYSQIVSPLYLVTRKKNDFH
ncbi:hypothetical protein DUI87_20045 [Hirundo rustica rustica]|uniref:Uncharacterized protein n=1 Tax=Hirundo rustica rustica TaxID=333673 RepID=A0A3M0JPD1_HIRRU|nr:hypothetical protein DUI87_20045 [Hirundo rustica rustica]